MSTVEIRACRLGVSLFIMGQVNQPPSEAIAATWPMLTEEAIGLFCGLDDEDIALGNACLEVEAERRARGWAALEAFGAAWTAGEGDPDTMDADDARAALRAAYELGWNFAPPDHEE